MTKKTAAIAVVFALMSATALLAYQRGQGRGGRVGPGGALPAYYKNTSAPLGAVDTAAADKACPVQNGAAPHERLMCLSAVLKTDMSPELLTRLQLAYTASDAARWSNFPPMGYRDRVGVTLAELTPAQRGAVKAIMKTAAGIAANEGYDEIEQILNADDFLKDNTGEQGFASGNFQIAFLGTPSASGVWQLYFGGHHLAFSGTFKNGALAGATPSFRGVEPFTTFKENGRDNAPMVQEQAAFAAMLGSFTDAQRGIAQLRQTYTDIIVGPQRDWTFPSLRSGIKASTLSDAQRAAIIRAIDTYVGDIDPPDAAKILAKYRSELADTYVAFSGTPQLNAENDYVRIDGPSVWIELSMQPGRSLPGIHPHSVWRDRATDYGGNK